MFELVQLSYFVSRVLAASGDDEDSGWWAIVFLASGFLFYAFMYVRYRNTDKRHFHEVETIAHISDVEGEDQFVKNLKKLKNARMKGANDGDVRGSRAGVDKNWVTDAAGKAQDMIDRQT